MLGVLSYIDTKHYCQNKLRKNIISFLHRLNTVTLTDFTSQIIC